MKKKRSMFTEKLHDLFEDADSGGLMTMEKVEIIRYMYGADDT